MITGVGKAMPANLAKWDNPNRPITASGMENFSYFFKFSRFHHSFPRWKCPATENFAYFSEFGGPPSF